MQLSDYEAVYGLWTATPGMGLSAADSRDGIKMLLDRNPGLSLVGEIDGRLAGSLLLSQDGRRGFLHHLAVAVEFRGRGLGRCLVESGLERFREVGLKRCNLLVFANNDEGRNFWKHLGFRERTELLMVSRDL